jgi:hypothetical protein
LHFGQRGEFLAFGLGDVEHVHGAEADELRLRLAFVRGVLGVDVGRDFVLARPPISDHRGEDENAFLAALDEAAKRVPSANSRNVGSIRLLTSSHTLPMYRRFCVFTIPTCRTSVKLRG